MPYFVESGGAYKRVLAGYANVEGAWKRVLGRWVEVGGAWKLKFSAATIGLIPATIRGFAYSPDVPYARLDFARGGTVTASYTDQTVNQTEVIENWYEPEDPNAGTRFEIMAVMIAGAAPVTGSPLNQWLLLDATRSWQVDGGHPYNTTKAATIELSIRAQGGATPLATSQFTLSTTTYSASNPNGYYGKGGGIDSVKPYRFQQ